MPAVVHTAVFCSITPKQYRRGAVDFLANKGCAGFEARPAQGRRQ
jgi:hypothetical protein